MSVKFKCIIMSLFKGDPANVSEVQDSRNSNDHLRGKPKITSEERFGTFV